MKSSGELVGNGNESLAEREILYRLDWHRNYPQSVQRVWTAISDQIEISAWMGYPTKLELHPGGLIHIDFSAQDSLEGTVCNIEPLRLLVYTWGDSLVKWELDLDAENTKLHLVHVGVRPELAAGLGAGWHAFLDQLEDHLGGSGRPARYRELKSRYEAELKP